MKLFIFAAFLTALFVFEVGCWMCACALGEEMCVSNPFSPCSTNQRSQLLPYPEHGIEHELPQLQVFGFALFQGPNDALGVSIAGGKGSPLGDIPIFIAMIQASGVAARTQRLRVSAGVLNISCFISPRVP